MGSNSLTPKLAQRKLPILRWRGGDLSSFLERRHESTPLTCASLRTDNQVARALSVSRSIMPISSLRPTWNSDALLAPVLGKSLQIDRDSIRGGTRGDLYLHLLYRWWQRDWASAKIPRIHRYGLCRPLSEGKAAPVICRPHATRRSRSARQRADLRTIRSGCARSKTGDNGIRTLELACWTDFHWGATCSWWIGPAAWLDEERRPESADIAALLDRLGSGVEAGAPPWRDSSRRVA